MKSFVTQINKKFRSYASLTLALLLAFTTLSCSPREIFPQEKESDKNSQTKEVQQRFDDVTLDILTFEGPIGKTVTSHAHKFEALTGVTINIKTVSFGEVHDAILQDFTSETNQYEVVFFVSQWLVDYAEPGYLEDITEEVEQDSALQWEDLAPFFRDFAAKYRDRVYGIPVDGDYHMVYYRSDLLAQAALDPPKTWEDYLTIAEKFHGQDFTGDGNPDYGSCIAKQPQHAGHWMFGSILSAHIQSQGTQQGAFFDPETMKPLVNNPAFAKALDIYKQTSKYGHPDEQELDVLNIMDMEVLQHCALTIFWGDIGPLANGNSQLKDKMGAVILPGSTEVLDRETNKLVACDKFTCPFAFGGVNYAPYAANIGWSGGINQAATTIEKQASYAFISYISQPQQSNIDVTQGGSGFNPYRISQFTKRDAWLKSGMSPEATNKYLGGISASLNSPNMVLDLTIPQSHRYQQEILDQAISQFIANEISRDEAIKQIEGGWEQLTTEIGRKKQLAAYRNSLGLEPQE